MPKREASRPSPKRRKLFSGADTGGSPSAPDRHSRDPEQPVSFIGSVGHLVHAVAFLLLGAASLYYFGRVFFVVSGAMAVLALVSLREGWGELRRVRESRKT